MEAGLEEGRILGGGRHGGRKVGKRDAGNAILNTWGKTGSAIFSVCNKQIGLRLLLWLYMPVLKPQ